MDRYWKNLDAEKVQHKGCLLPVTFIFRIKTEMWGIKPTSLSRRNFFVTSSSHQVVKKMESFSCSGDRASRVLCCPSSTWIWPGMVWESWLSSRWRDCTSYRCLLGLSPTISGKLIMLVFIFLSHLFTKYSMNHWMDLWQWMILIWCTSKLVWTFCVNPVQDGCYS